MTRRRLAAIVALLLAPATVAWAVVVAVGEFPRGLFLVACLLLASVVGWYGLLRRGLARVVGVGVAVLALVAAVVLLVVDGDLLGELLVAAGLAISLAAAKAAFAVRVPLPRAPAPRRPVLFLNPRSGGGKAERFSLASEARARGIEAVELQPGSDLEALARDAVASGADAVAMAGGDGSQAIVAAIAAERQLPYACIPSGTRNHFALDLGVDRNDVVGALDAFVDGGERVVDLAEVNGRVFVNNVSLGLYATAVQREAYRGAKLRTLLDTMPDVLGPAGRRPDLRWTGPHGGSHVSGTVMLISNNRYRLGPVMGSGTRPRIDDGELGIAVMESPPDRVLRRLVPRRPWQQWSARDFEVRSAEQVPAGIDGEATVLTPPLRFRAKPCALRVRIAAGHPGASPSASRPHGIWRGFRTLVSIAAGRTDGHTAAPR